MTIEQRITKLSLDLEVIIINQISLKSWDTETNVFFPLSKVNIGFSFTFISLSHISIMDIVPMTLKVSAIIKILINITRLFSL